MLAALPSPSSVAPPSPSTSPMPQPVRQWIVAWNASRAVLLDRFEELGQPVAGLGRRANDRGLPRAVFGEREHLRQVARGLVRSGTVRLVYDEHVGDLEDPRLDRLDVVAETRDRHQTDGIDDANDVDLLLTDANGLDEYDVGPERVEHVHDPGRRAGETAGVPATCHRTNEDALVEEPLAHPDAVAEDGAAAE